MTKIKAIIFGATGMVGEGVLHEALHDERVESILSVSRRPCGVKHEKLHELVHRDFFDYTAIERQMQGYNACFFCLGVSSIGMNEINYRRVTYDLTMAAAKTLAHYNPDMVFCYISGLGTDSTETGRSMWARVKGKTENDLMKLPFKAVYAYRPGYMKPAPGLKNALIFSKALAPLYPLLKILFPSYVGTLQDVGRSMINVAVDGCPKQILECRDITRTAGRFCAGEDYKKG